MSSSEAAMSTCKNKRARPQAARALQLSLADVTTGIARSSKLPILKLAGLKPQGSSLQVKIVWWNYPVVDSSWEPFRNASGCDLALAVLLYDISNLKKSKEGILVHESAEDFVHFITSCRLSNQFVDFGEADYCQFREAEEEYSKRSPALYYPGERDDGIIHGTFSTVPLDEADVDFDSFDNLMSMACFKHLLIDEKRAKGQQKVFDVE